MSTREIIKRSLQQATIARVGLGRAGSAIATDDHLRFQLDHAQARDAVKATLDERTLLRGLAERGLQAVALRSAVYEAPDEDRRRTYLRRPDLGRNLSQDSAASLRELARTHPQTPDIVFVIADGLSSLAAERHALPVLDAARALLPSDAWSLGPVCVVEQARVAIGDIIGHFLGARCAVVLIGERPGLSAADSLGIYITWSPQPGRTDAERNCISNIRPEGLSYIEAARRLRFYLTGARHLQRSGIDLKQNTIPALETAP